MRHVPRLAELFVALALGLGCSSGEPRGGADPEPPRVQTPATPSVAECDARVALMRERFAAMQTRPSVATMPTFEYFELPTLTERTRDADVVAPLVTLTHTGLVAVDGRAETGETERERYDAVRSDVTTSALLAGALATGAGRTAPMTRRVYLLADRRVLVRAVDALVRAAFDDVPVEVVATVPSLTPSPPGCPASLGAFCGRLTPSLAPAERATLIAGELTRVVGECAPLVRTFGQLSLVDRSHRPAMLVREIPAGARECRCAHGLDLAGLEYLVRITAGVYEAPRALVTWRRPARDELDLTMSDWIARHAHD